MRLFCLPYAGGGMAAYYRWRPAIPRWLDLIPVTLPGHDGRLREPPCTDLRQLAATLADELLPRMDRAFALLGYSLGAWAAFELARELRRRDARLPELLVVAASRAPDAAPSDSPLHRLPDEELVEEVERRYGGIPAAVRSSPELLQLLLPALRADLQMVETYEFAEEPPLESPIFALGGTEDRAVTAAQLGEWRRHTSGGFSVRLLPGGHFFLFPGAEEASTPSGKGRAGEPSPALQVIFTRLEGCAPAEPGDSNLAD